MNGYSSHTYKWYNAAGEFVWVQYHFKTEQGIKNLTAAEANEMKAADPDHATRDLFEAIERGEFPSWRLEMQIMTPEEAETYRFRPLRYHQGLATRRLSAHHNRQVGARPEPRELLRRDRAGGVLARQLRAGHRPVTREAPPGASLQLPRHPPAPAGRQLSTCCP